MDTIVNIPNFVWLPIAAILWGVAAWLFVVSVFLIIIPSVIGAQRAANKKAAARLAAESGGGVFANFVRKCFEKIS